MKRLILFIVLAGFLCGCDDEIQVAEPNGIGGVAEVHVEPLLSGYKIIREIRPGIVVLESAHHTAEVEVPGLSGVRIKNEITKMESYQDEMDYHEPTPRDGRTVAGRATCYVEMDDWRGSQATYWEARLRHPAQPDVQVPWAGTFWDGLHDDEGRIRKTHTYVNSVAWKYAKPQRNTITIKMDVPKTESVTLRDYTGDIDMDLQMRWISYTGGSTVEKVQAVPIWFRDGHIENMMDLHDLLLHAIVLEIFTPNQDEPPTHRWVMLYGRYAAIELKLTYMLGYYTSGPVLPLLHTGASPVVGVYDGITYITADPGDTLRIGPSIRDVAAQWLRVDEVYVPVDMKAFAKVSGVTR